MPRKILDDKAKLKNGNELVINEDKEFYPLALEFWVKDLYKEKVVKKGSFTTVYHCFFSLTGEYPNISDYEDEKKIQLNAEHILLLCFLMGYAGINYENKCFYGSNSTLAEIMGVSSRTVERYLTVLEKTGFITRSILNKSKRRIFINYARIEYYIFILAGYISKSDIAKEVKDKVVETLTKKGLFKSEEQKQKFIETYYREIDILDTYSQSRAEEYTDEKLCQHVAVNLINNKNRSKKKEEKSTDCKIERRIA